MAGSDQSFSLTQVLRKVNGRVYWEGDERISRQLGGASQQRSSGSEFPQTRHCARFEFSFITTYIIGELRELGTDIFPMISKKYSVDLSCWPGSGHKGDRLDSQVQGIGRIRCMDRSLRRRPSWRV